MKIPKVAGNLEGYFELERILTKALELNNEEIVLYCIRRIHELYTGCELWTYRDFNKKAVNILFSKKFKIGFIPIPKNACTSLKILLYKLDFDRDFFPGYESLIHEYYSYPSYEPQDVLTIFKEYSIACFLRDPVSRFISGYCNKICEEKILFSIYHPLNKFYQIDDLDLLTSEEYISSFLDNLEFYRQISIEIRHHFSPQTYFLDGSEEFRELITFFLIPDDIQIFHEWLFEKTKVGLTLPVLNTSKIKISHLSEEIISKIRKVYIEDLHLIESYKTGYFSF